MNREINTIGSKADGAGVAGTDRRGQGRAGADARAGAECRVRSAGLLFIVSAPSGAGKTTVVRRRGGRGRRAVRISRSYTSRQPQRRGAGRRGLPLRGTRDAVRGDARRGGVPGVGRGLRPALRHAARPTPSACWPPDAISCWSSTCRVRRRSGSAACRGRDLPAAAVVRRARVAAAGPKRGLAGAIRRRLDVARREIEVVRRLRLRRRQRRSRACVAEVRGHRPRRARAASPGGGRWSRRCWTQFRRRGIDAARQE